MSMKSKARHPHKRKGRGGGGSADVEKETNPRGRLHDGGDREGSDSATKQDGQGFPATPEAGTKSRTDSPSKPPESSVPTP